MKTTIGRLENENLLLKDETTALKTKVGELEHAMNLHAQTCTASKEKDPDLAVSSEFETVNS